MDHENPRAELRENPHDLSYDESVAVRPPVSEKLSIPPLSVPDEEIGSPSATSADARSRIAKANDNIHSSSSVRGSDPSLHSEPRSTNSVTSTPNVPQIRIDNRPASLRKDDKVGLALRRSIVSETNDSQGSFHGLALNIPGAPLSEEIPTKRMEFSNRGSMLIDGQKLNGRSDGDGSDLNTKASTQESRSISSLREEPSPKLLSTEEETLSQKVRSFYEAGTDEPGASDSIASLGRKIGLRWQNALDGAENGSINSASRATSTTDAHSDTAAAVSLQGGHGSTMRRENNELAGGLEDWQDIDNADVDRYGFIVPRSPIVRSFENGSTASRTPKQLQRVSSSLQLASETPRRRTTIRRTPSQATKHRQSADQKQFSATPDMRSSTSQSSFSVGRHSTIRNASNQLPHNKSRKLMDEASNMLTLPPTTGGNLAAAQQECDTRARQKETEREEKWRKMARVVSSNSGGGMVFEFDTRSPKLIERTWKGIPDRWRATAWHAFLSASAKKKHHPSDKVLIEQYNDYMTQTSADDVQIDIDVPRTISSHIMFRRRYRGGQRLLFRVLHAMSLHYPETGYVQGMATLAATLLAYYEEEKAFVMLARLWDVRGLDKLYKSGFGGLMQALDDFEKHWLGAGEVATKLNSLGISPTAYGTRWYLTLFNYSIPFPAQLRVWDIFMLLGDEGPASASSSSQFGTTLDVLHATSAALIDGVRDILLDSDFENAMKVLTSWIPIKDEDLFMRIAKVEWKLHKRKS